MRCEQDGRIRLKLGDSIPYRSSDVDINSWVSVQIGIPVVGSSRNKTWGFPAAAMARDVFRLLPPDNSRVCTSLNSSSPTDAISLSTSSSSRVRSFNLSAAYRRICSRGVRFSHSMSFCEQYPINLRTLGSKRGTAGRWPIETDPECALWNS